MAYTQADLNIIDESRLSLRRVSKPETFEEIGQQLKETSTR